MSAEPVPALPLSETAERLAGAILAAAGSRVTIGLRDIFDALDEVEPGLATSPGKRARVGELLEELAAVDFIEPSRTRVDRSEVPALPAFVRVKARSPGRVAVDAAGYPWRPELAFAASESLSEREFSRLRAVQAFLRDGGADRLVVPAPERSLELFGHEKVLDEEIRPGRLWSLSRLNYEMLRTRRPATPLPHRVVGPGSWILIAENAATFDSLAAAMPPDSPVGIVAWGGGGLFRSTVEGIVDIASIVGRPIEAIRYFGDLDLEGLRIPIAASVVAEKASLPPVRPAVGLYARLLRAGQRDPAPPLPPEVAAELTAWLGPSLAIQASSELVSGARLAQEVVGREWLEDNRLWPTAAGLGPGRSGVALATPEQLGIVSLPSPGGSRPMGPDALVVDDVGRELVPNDAAWAGWVAAGRTRNWIHGDPIIDWLNEFGDAAGFERDETRPGYDRRTDFRTFVLEKGRAFEAGVMRLLGERVEIVQIATERGDSRSLAKAEATIPAMRDGVAIVAQAVLRNPANQTYGVADLLVRSDLLADWFPELLSWEEATAGAPGIGQAHLHYRAVDIKFHSFDLVADGHVGLGADQLAYAGQVWLYNEALGRVQGYTPPASFLLGRTWLQGEDRGRGCLERLARVDHDRWVPNREASIGDIVAQAAHWIRRVRRDGADWSVLPLPSVAELYPHARNTDDGPWHAAKREISERVGELTLLPAMNPQRRATAHAAGYRRWDDPSLSAEVLGVTSEVSAARLDAVLAANRADPPAVLPDRVVVADPAWREVAPVELYVDFETVSNLDDDFGGLPLVGGGAQIVQIGCGHLDSTGEWTFRQWTVDALTAEAEGIVIGAWLDYVSALCAGAGAPLAAARLFHWSAAEPVNLDTAYSAARTRHLDADWPQDLPWFDLLDRLIRAEPISVTGAFNFGLKSIAKAMHGAGLIATTWDDGPTDGLGAMIGTWSAAREAQAQGIPLTAHPLMIEIGRYNEADCRVMAEALAWFRANR